MAQGSRMGAVCDAVLRLATGHPEGVSIDAISCAMHVQTSGDQKKLSTILSELHQAGRIRRISRGVYGLPANPQKREKRQIMWAALRMRRRVMVDDLMEMAEASAEYARQWLRMLASQGVVRRERPAGGKAIWHLIKDSRAMPECRENADKLRALRKRKKGQEALSRTCGILIAPRSAQKNVRTFAGKTRNILEQ